MTSIPGSKEPGIFAVCGTFVRYPFLAIQWVQINRKVVHSSEKHQFDVFSPADLQDNGDRTKKEEK